MISAAQCLEFARQYKVLCKNPNTSPDRAFLMKNIARSLAGLAGQLDRLDALTREEQHRGSALRDKDAFLAVKRNSLPQKNPNGRTWLTRSAKSY